jgi:hypothetical protein
VNRFTALLTACVTGLVVAAPVSIAHSSASGHAVVAPCRIAQLRFTPREGLSEKTEQHTTALSIQNIASLPCVLYGYPTLDLLDSTGHTLPFSYRHQGDQMITAARPRRVRLGPSGSAFFAFNKNTCVGRASRFAQALRVMPPAGRASRVVQLGSRAVDYCGSRDPGHVVSVSPFESRFHDAFCFSQGPCRRR